MQQNETNLQTKFISQDNKHILWEIMVKNNIFDGIPDKYANTIKLDFEERLKQIKGTITPNDTILDLNKKIISQMMENIKKYLQPLSSYNIPVSTHHVPVSAHHAPVSTHHVPVSAHHVPVTSNEILTKKQAQFQQGLQNKQEEFNRLIKPVKPQNIDFSDKIDDEPIGSEMDIKLSQTIAWREKQLSQVLERQNTIEASNWINNGKKTNVSTNSNRITNIKIGNITKFDDNNIINLTPLHNENTQGNNTIQHTNNNVNILNEKIYKKVSFSDDNNIQLTQFNFINKLKKKDGIEELKTDVCLINTELTSVNTELTNVNTELTSVNTELTSVNTELTSVNTDFEFIKNDINFIKNVLNQLSSDNKLILENQTKIMDKIEQIAFQVGSI